MADVADTPLAWPLVGRREVADARVFSLVADDIVAPSGAVLTRSYLRHPGAVAVIALDDEGRVVVVRQYRHPLGMRLIEPPAGLLDGGAGETALAAAQRELAEEVALAADDWRTLVDFGTTPGSSEETIRVFLARGLRDVPRPVGFTLEAEEADMGVDRVPLGELVDGVLGGRLQCPTLCVGVLALQAALLEGRLDDLRAPDAPWPARACKEALDGARVD